MGIPIIYSHLTKGYTVGYSVTRRICRTITGVIGIPIDLVIACFWLPNYKQYWKDFSYYYPDNTPVSGVQGLFGYIGDIVGTVIGACLGTVIAGILYIPDFILSLLITMIYENICKFTKSLNTLIKENQDRYIICIKNPDNFLSKSWNISAITLGTVIAFFPWLTFRIIEAFIPWETHIFSEFFWHAGQFIGGVVGAFISVPLFIAKKLCDGTKKCYTEFRNGIRETTALSYALTDVYICKKNDAYECIPPQSIHSDEFRKRVQYYKKKGNWVHFFARGEFDKNEDNELLNENQEGVINENVPQ